MFVYRPSQIICRLRNPGYEFGEICVYKLIASHLRRPMSRKYHAKFTQQITRIPKLINQACMHAVHQKSGARPMVLSGLSRINLIHLDRPPPLVTAGNPAEISAVPERGGVHRQSVLTAHFLHRRDARSLLHNLRHFSWR